jgi:hypothetical protein|tara:strand:+ start:489 stop:716 length:228 start_codon:yes stop_codon:yes gene_type:complete
MIKTIHSKPIDGPEAGVVTTAIVACLLHLGGFVTLDPVDFGISIGAVITPVVMFAVRMVSAAGKKVEEAVEGEEE